MEADMEVLEAEYMVLETTEPADRPREESPVKDSFDSIKNNEIMAEKLLPVMENSREKGLSAIIFQSGLVAVERESLKAHPQEMKVIRESIKSLLKEEISVTLLTTQQIETLYSDLLEKSNPDSRKELTHKAQQEFQKIVAKAVKYGATDIHLYLRKQLSVQFRVDKIIRDELKVSHPRSLGKKMFNSIINSLGAERGDGDGLSSSTFQSTTFSMEVDDGTNKAKKIELRIEKAPLDDEIKECIAIYVRLSQSDIPKSLEELKVDKPLHEELRRVMQLGQGLVLVTGPTGSGKTTLVHAALKEFPKNKAGRTLEDPVELRTSYNENISQVSKPKDEWEDGLVSMLRQDPDMVFLGEIRDKLAADILIQACRTGHLTLSTLHTTSAIGTIGRLIDMGVKPVDLAEKGVLELVVATRLASKTCTKCYLSFNEISKEKQDRIKNLELPKNTENNMRFVNSNSTNCHCNKGVKGMVGVSEYLVPDDTVRALIHDNRVNDIQAYLEENGWMDLREVALSKVIDGVIDPFQITQEVGDVFDDGKDNVNYLEKYGNAYNRIQK